MSRERLVVVGADAGGMTAASQARRRRPADQLEIVAVDRGRHASYSACGIPYWIGGAVDSVDALVTRTVEEFRKQDIEVRLRHEAVSLDLAAGAVLVRDLDGGGETRLGFDQLVVATGATPVRPDIPGVDAPGVFGVQTLDDGEEVRAALAAGAERAVVVGGGYIGLEMAEAFVQRGLAVTVVEAAPQPMSTLDPDMGALVAGAVEGLGIELLRDAPVTGIVTGADGRARAVATADREIPADVVVLGLGVRPGTELARAAGVEIGVTGGVVTDARMRTVSHEQVWAAGDCVQTIHRVSRAPVSVPLGTHANKQGRVAGINLGGGYATFPGVVGTSVTKVCDLEVARTGLREADADDAGFRFVTATVESTTRAGYFPDARPITTKLIAERRSGRLLGAQIVGREGAAKRIDVLATALWNDMTVEDIAGLDLSYAPPFAPVWDPVLIAARKAWEAVERDVADWYAAHRP
ncbi:MAG TPA: FAD-dependent oxidoreductase [Mycobacteriales bacterium]|nr:FAD-dependent oxidoreductase [Mycobacteriales bacterium]